MEKIYGSFCPDCYSSGSGAASSSRSGEQSEAPNYAMFFGLLLLSLVVIGGIAVLLLLTH